MRKKYQTMRLIDLPLYDSVTLLIVITFLIGACSERREVLHSQNDAVSVQGSGLNSISTNLQHAVNVPLILSDSFPDRNYIKGVAFSDVDLESTAESLKLRVVVASGEIGRSYCELRYLGATHQEATALLTFTDDLDIVLRSESEDGYLLEIYGDAFDARKLNSAPIWTFSDLTFSMLEETHRILVFSRLRAFKAQMSVKILEEELRIRSRVDEPQQFLSSFYKDTTRDEFKYFDSNGKLLEAGWPLIGRDSKQVHCYIVLTDYTIGNDR